MKKKHKGWPRWAKVARNLLLTLLFALTVWSQLGKPLPYNADIRRLERQHLIPKTEHSVEIPDSYFGAYSSQIDWTEGAAIVSAPARHGLNNWIPTVIANPVSLEDGTSLIPIPWTKVRYVFNGSNQRWETSAVYAAVFPPEGSVNASLTVHNNAGEFTASSQRENDAFIFYVKAGPVDEDGNVHMDSSWFSTEFFHYELLFYDEAGEVVGEISG